MVGLITAMKPGSSNLENAAKKLYGRGAVDQRKEFIGELIDQQPYASFGVQRVKEEEGK